MKNLCLLYLMLFTGGLFAQSYNVLLIPDSLKKNADMVVRKEELVMEIKSPGRAVLKEKHVYSILNEAAAKYAGYDSRYDKFTAINYINATLYDAMGKEIKHVKKKDMQDVSGNSESSLMDDSRYKTYDFYYRTYPYTVEYEEEDDLNGIRGFANWMPVGWSGRSVEYSKYVIIAPKDYNVRYKPVNCNIQPVITEAGDKKIYTWEAKNLLAMKTESYAPDWYDLVPSVLFAPSEFEVDGYKGSMSSWEGYGKFIYQLIKGKDILPDNIKAKVHELTDGLTDTRQKVNVLYDFMQKNTHYISIQLGIGGWQPFDATYVATKKYGDCKALSNYMVALLKEAGIKGKYVEIWSGRNARPIIEDFPFSQGDHVIACVPMPHDTIWLECTSQTVSPGFMGSFTGDRKAILIDEDGAHIVNTPKYNASENLQLRVVDATINNEGNLDAQVKTHFTGIEQEEAHGLLHEASKEQRDRYLNESLNLPTYQIDKSNYEEQKGTIPVINEYLHVISAGYASITGKRIFIAPNLFNKTGLKYSLDSVRKYDIVYKQAFRDIDSVAIQIPAGYQPESIPQNVKIESRFGKYASSVKIENDRIYYYRFYEKNKSRFPATEYTDLVKFQDQIYKADKSRIVLVKKE